MRLNARGEGQGVRRRRGATADGRRRRQRDQPGDSETFLTATLSDQLADEDTGWRLSTFGSCRGATGFGSAATRRFDFDGAAAGMKLRAGRGGLLRDGGRELRQRNAERGGQTAEQGQPGEQTTTYQHQTPTRSSPHGLPLLENGSSQFKG